MRKPRKPWLPHHTSTLEQMAGHYTDEEISRMTGHSTITIRIRRTLLGLPACRRKDWTKRTWKVAA